MKRAILLFVIFLAQFPDVLYSADLCNHTIGVQGSATWCPKGQYCNISAGSGSYECADCNAPNDGYYGGYGGNAAGPTASGACTVTLFPTECTQLISTSTGSIVRNGALSCSVGASPYTTFSCTNVNTVCIRESNNFGGVTNAKQRCSATNGPVSGPGSLPATGTFQVNASCTYQCPTGYYLNGTTCTSCDAGYACPGTPSTVWLAASATITTTTGSNNPRIPCGNNTYASGGTVGGTGNTACSACQTGSVGSTASNAYNTSAGPNTKCVCNSGFGGAWTNANTGCTQCGTGTTTQGAGVRTYKDWVGNDSCESCLNNPNTTPDNYTQNSTIVKTDTAGDATNPPGSRCVCDGANTVGNWERTNASAASDANKTDFQNSCTLCNTDTAEVYSDNYGNSSCRCKKGFYGTGGGLPSHLFNANGGPGYCTECPVDTFNDSPGQLCCIKCKEGCTTGGAKGALKCTGNKLRDSVGWINVPFGITCGAPNPKIHITEKTTI